MIDRYDFDTVQDFKFKTRNIPKPDIEFWNDGNSTTGVWKREDGDWVQWKDVKHIVEAYEKNKVFDSETYYNNLEDYEQKTLVRLIRLMPNMNYKFCYEFWKWFSDHLAAGWIGDETYTDEHILKSLELYRIELQRKAEIEFKGIPISYGKVLEDNFWNLIGDNKEIDKRFFDNLELYEQTTLVRLKKLVPDISYNFAHEFWTWFSDRLCASWLSDESYTDKQILEALEEYEDELALAEKYAREGYPPITNAVNDFLEKDLNKFLGEDEIKTALDDVEKLPKE